MNQVSRIFIGGAAAVLAMNTIGAILSVRMDFSYAALTPLSFAINAITAFLVGRSSTLWWAVVVSAGVAFTEATVGWAIAWAIGPGRPPDGYTGMLPIAFAVVIVTISGGLTGVVGGSLGRLFRRKPG